MLWYKLVLTGEVESDAAEWRVAEPADETGENEVVVVLVEVVRPAVGLGRFSPIIAHHSDLQPLLSRRLVAFAPREPGGGRVDAAVDARHSVLHASRSPADHLRRQDRFGDAHSAPRNGHAHVDPRRRHVAHAQSHDLLTMLSAPLHVDRLVRHGPVEPPPGWLNGQLRAGARRYAPLHPVYGWGACRAHPHGRVHLYPRLACWWWVSYPNVHPRRLGHVHLEHRWLVAELRYRLRIISHVHVIRVRVALRLQFHLYEHLLARHFDAIYYYKSHSTA